MSIIQLNQPNQSTNWANSAQELSNTLQTLQPDNSSLTRIITYALIATALVGIFVYHYIKEQEVSR